MRESTQRPSRQYYKAHAFTARINAFKLETFVAEHTRRDNQESLNRGRIDDGGRGKGQRQGFLININKSAAAAAVATKIGSLLKRNTLHSLLCPHTHTLHAALQIN